MLSHVLSVRSGAMAVPFASTPWHAMHGPPLNDVSPAATICAVTPGGNAALVAPPAGAAAVPSVVVAVAGAAAGVVESVVVVEADLSPPLHAATLIASAIIE